MEESAKDLLVAIYRVPNRLGHVVTTWKQIQGNQRQSCWCTRLFGVNPAPARITFQPINEVIREFQAIDSVLNFSVQSGQLKLSEHVGLSINLSITCLMLAMASDEDPIEESDFGDLFRQVDQVALGRQMDKIEALQRTVESWLESRQIESCVPFVRKLERVLQSAEPPVLMNSVEFWPDRRRIKFNMAKFDYVMTHHVPRNQASFKYTKLQNDAPIFHV